MFSGQRFAILAMFFNMSPKTKMSAPKQIPASKMMSARQKKTSLLRRLLVQTLADTALIQTIQMVQIIQIIQIIQKVHKMEKEQKLQRVQKLQKVQKV